MNSAHPDRILIDFEQAAINAFRQAFPSAQLQGCYFHLCQCLVRKVQNLGLRQLFDNVLHIKLMIKSLAALAFVPPADVIPAFNTLCLEFPHTDPRFDELLTYFEATWVYRPGGGPRFPIELWNHYGTAGAGSPRTINCCEGWHNSMNSHFLCQHPSIWSLLKALKEDMDLSRLLLVHAQTGVLENNNKKYEIISQRVSDTVNEYADYVARGETLRYLRRLAALQ